MKTSFEKFMASSAVQSVELGEVKVELASYQDELAAIEKEYRNGLGMMETYAIKLEQEENKVRESVAKYRDVIAKSKVNILNDLKKYGITELPADWKRMFDKLDARVRDIKSIKGIVSTVKSV
jgi:septation ring formation regulator EzrA